MSTDDPSQYAPPFEFRIPLATVVDSSDGPAVAGNPFLAEPPAPSAVASASPGLSTGAAAPPIAPSLPDLSDPSQVALLMARMFGEHLTGSSVVPTPNLAQTMSGIGVPGQAATPGFAASPIANPSTPGGEAVPAIPPSPSSDVLATSLAPGQVEVPTATGVPRTPTLTGGTPALGSGGTSMQSFGSADPTSPASLAGAPGADTPVASSPFTIAPSYPAALSTSFPAIGEVPAASSTVPAASSTMPATSNTVPASSTGDARGLADARELSSSPSYRHGGTDAGGFARYGAPPDLDAFLAVQPTAHGLPHFDVREPFVAPLDDVCELPTSPTGGYAAPTNVEQPAVPSTSAAPSSPMGSPEVPTAAKVPSSSPFGAPIDLGAMLMDPTHVTHVSTVPTWNEPSTGAVTTDLPYYVMGGDDARIVRELGRQAFDPYTVRKDFPILDEKVHGKRLVWLDNAATTQKPRQVIDRISYFYAHENSNVHRAAHTLAARSTDAFERARESARRFINAPTSKEIVWVRGATEGINLIAKTWGKKFVGKGDEIVITHLEHHANIVPWQMLCAEVGAKLKVAPVDERGDVILEGYERLMGPRTKLVSIPHVSNALGTITPTKQMVEIAHRYGAHVMVDGAQAVSHMKVDVQDLGCEWYVFSGHKVFAPTGIGVVWGKSEVLAAAPPWQGGGNMIEDVTFEHTRYQPPPWKFEAGTGSIGDAVGLGAAIEYVESIGMDVIDRYEHELLVYGTQRLQTVPGLTIIGTSRHKAGVLSFVLDGQKTEDVSAILDKDGIAVRSGHHCAQPILRRYGLEATVRASLAFYNVCEDIDALVESLHRLQAGRG